MVGIRNKCARCGKEESKTLPKLFAPWKYCRCAPQDPNRTLQDATVKTAAATPELESEYIDQDLSSRYRILNYIGSGGGGIIYKVSDRRDGEEVVLKLIKRDLPEQAKQRFEMEAQACTLISHPNVVQVLEYGVTSAGVHYIVMPHCQGESLRTLMQNKRLSDLDTIVEIFLQICAGLDAAHKAGIVHRDMKPENVLVDKSDGNPVVHIIDFGIAKVAPAGGEIQALTQTGEIFGTPAYMSPEQCTGRRVDFRTDIYAIGCMLFEAFVGQPPFRAENSFLTLTLHIEHAPPAVPRIESLKTIAEPLERIVHRCLEKDPDHRYQKMTELARDISALRAANSVIHKIRSQFTKRRLTIVAMALLLVASVSAAIQIKSWMDKSAEVKKRSEKDKVLASLDKAIIAIDKGDPNKAIEITNAILKKLHDDGILGPDGGKVPTDTSYSATVAETLWVRGHAYLASGPKNPQMIDKAQTDFKSCVKLSPKDPFMVSGLAATFLMKQDATKALAQLEKVRPTRAVVSIKLGRPSSFNDGWNKPDILERIKSANQEIVYQGIVRVNAHNYRWTAVPNCELKPDSRLWIDCSDNHFWSIGIKHGDEEIYSDADGKYHTIFHEQNCQSLLGMVGNNHSFLVGRHTWNAIAPGTGPLRLICNDSPPTLGSMPVEGFPKEVNSDNKGTMIVRVIVTRPLKKDFLAGWTIPNLYKLIETSNQKIVFENIVTIDSRNPSWTTIDGINITPEHRIWLDCKEGERCDFTCPPDGVSRNPTVWPASGKPGYLLHGFPGGAILGTIGEGNRIFPVGTQSPNMMPRASGQLKLIFNDGFADSNEITTSGIKPDAFGDNKGYFTVRVVVTEPKKQNAAE